MSLCPIQLLSPPWPSLLDAHRWEERSTNPGFLQIYCSLQSYYLSHAFGPSPHDGTELFWGCGGSISVSPVPGPMSQLNSPHGTSYKAGLRWSCNQVPSPSPTDR